MAVFFSLTITGPVHASAVFFALTTEGPALTAAAVTDIKNKLLAKYQVSFSFVLTSYISFFLSVLTNYYIRHDVDML